MPKGDAKKNRTHCPQGHEFTPENIYINPSTPNTRVCRACVKTHRKSYKDRYPNYWKFHQKKRHGLTEEQYNRFLLIQSGCCAVCKNPFVLGEPPRIDHDHKCCQGAYSCGKCVRGLLCINCNWGIGSLKDNPQIIRNAADYLEHYPAQKLAA